ncbi:hypothetical protein HMPREF0663_11901 [Hoylesella oralis ATCC 33269]|uniref:BACON domain-containing protein n=1 Tax=Hoylesella oralis ATCC 33269 TaxID=873533 RepID=E7RRV0_9BACT|nr:BACON domain-containing protein [Hoylesella oralis]EFZ36988.1 hypothetical protein HMPREF0663_11901 [Hoylesella oralis ATCC 33269]EPH18668.1 hypothetical protein HMPREF1475_00576 [Hoylesella oralis HGA0225]SHF78436.1 hypothetical protein SAMN05444288_1537 [Hoylesella oralis]
MAIKVRNTNYSGEVLEQILTTAATGNEIVEKGLICMIPGVEKTISVPRLRTGKMLQKRKENPTVDDSKGDFDYTEQKLVPQDFMAFTVFNPRTFENIWRKFQPKGNLVFSQLPPDVQNKLLEALSKQVKFELGDHYVNGEYGNDDDHLFDGILTQMAKDGDVIVVTTTETTMTGKLKAVRGRIPVAIRNNPNLRILMSIADFDTYDDELTKRDNKNADETAVNIKRYKGIAIETLAAWPDGVIVATLCSPDADGNLFAAVNLQDDEDVIQIDKVSNMSELYFCKLLMKADTNIAFGEEVVVLDSRTKPKFKAVEEKVTLSKQALTFTAAGGSETITVTATGSYTYSKAPNGYSIEDTEDGVKITAAPNESKTAEVTGKITFTLREDKAKKTVLTLTTSKAV